MAKGSSLIIIFAAYAAFLFVFPKIIYPADSLKIPTSEVKTVVKDEIVAEKIPDGYYLEIPQLGIFEEIKEEVNPYSITDYMPQIVNHIAQAAGTAKDLTYLFAHSSNYRYNGIESKAIFASLDSLTPGDSILLNRNGYIKKYAVVTKKIVNDTDLSPLVQIPDDDTLVMQTCWPLESLRTRLIVTAKPAPALASAITHSVH